MLELQIQIAWELPQQDTNDSDNKNRKKVVKQTFSIFFNPLMSLKSEISLLESNVLFELDIKSLSENGLNYVIQPVQAILCQKEDNTGDVIFAKLLNLIPFQVFCQQNLIIKVIILFKPITPNSSYRIVWQLPQVEVRSSPINYNLELHYNVDDDEDDNENRNGLPKKKNYLFRNSLCLSVPTVQ